MKEYFQSLDLAFQLSVSPFLSVLEQISENMALICFTSALIFRVRITNNSQP